MQDFTMQNDDHSRTGRSSSSCERSSRTRTEPRSPEEKQGPLLVHFVLVEPKVPENIGAAARALKTMGFHSLRLVRPGDYRSEPARRLAHGSTSVLDNAQVFETIEQALEDIDFTVATTARRRRLRRDYCDAGELPALIARKGGGLHTLALVFGPEERGLRTEEIMLCDTVSMVPMARKYPSLNLAQAVMVYAYALSPLVCSHARRTVKAPPAGELRALRRTTSDLLLRIGFNARNSAYNRILERFGLLSEIDVHLLHSVCSRLERYLERTRPEASGKQTGRRAGR
ncbi:MAG: tRNA/rRNA methyltransferase [Chitinivibrionales bacterium]|nr:tRNA/rRNA methyltransferase [Chitinivibrionales bacterium]